MALCQARPGKAPPLPPYQLQPLPCTTSPISLMLPPVDLPARPPQPLKIIHEVPGWERAWTHDAMEPIYK